MTHTPSYPEFFAVRSYVKSIGGHIALAELHDIDPRTAQRIYSGKIKLGPKLLAELLDAANA